MSRVFLLIIKKKNLLCFGAVKTKFFGAIQVSLWPFDKIFLSNICFSITIFPRTRIILHGRRLNFERRFLCNHNCAVSHRFFINILYKWIIYVYKNYTSTNTHIHTHVHIYTYIHIHIYISNFFCRNSHSWKMYFAISCISQGDTVCSCFTISWLSRNNIFT